MNKVKIFTSDLVLIDIFSSANRGVAGKNCDVCEANYWAYTSFGCRECSCNPQVWLTRVKVSQT